MSKQDTCIYYEYFGDYGMNICNHPSCYNKEIYESACRKCKLYQSEQDDLKRCPFCGGKASIRHYLGKFRVICSKCKIEMLDDKIDVVMKKWNKRTKGKIKNEQDK